MVALISNNIAEVAGGVFYYKRKQMDGIANVELQIMVLNWFLTPYKNMGFKNHFLPSMGFWFQKQIFFLKMGFQ